MIIERALLLPWPKAIRELPGVVLLPRAPRLRLDGVVSGSALTARLFSAFARRGLEPTLAQGDSETPEVLVLRDSSFAFANEGYELVAEGKSVVIRASTDAGAF
jgi:hypothetical protein